MNSLAYQGGVNLKRAVEATGRVPTIAHYAVAIALLAKEQGITIDEIVHELILAIEFDGAIHKLDKDKILRQLGY